MIGYFRVRLSKNEKQRRKLWSILTPYIQKKYLADVESILDIGAGQCGFANNFKAKTVIALDDDSEISKFALKSVRVIVGDFSILNQTAIENIDAIFVSNFIEHLSDDEVEVFIKVIKKLLKLGGKLVILQPNYRYSYKRYYDDFTHKKAWSHTSLEEYLISHGFSVEVLFPKFLPFSLKSNLPIWKPLLRMYLVSPWKPFAGQMFMVAKNLDKYE